MDVVPKSRASKAAYLVAGGVALLLGLAILAVTPVSAGAAIEIRPSTDPTAAPLATIKKGKCNKFGDLWLGGGKSTDKAWDLFVEIVDFDGYGPDYSLFYGTDRPAWFELKGPGGPYSNRHPIPGTPPGVVGAGAISFGGKKGKKLSIGAYAAPNEDFSQGVSFVGAMKCKYPKKKR